MSLDFFKSLENRIKGSINVSMLARVDKISGNRADVTPLQPGYTMIQNCPILDHVTVWRGDTVLIVFSDHSLDGSSEELHSIDDAIVVGRVRE